MQAVGLAHVQDRMNNSLAQAMAPVEYGYFFTILYTILGTPLGLTLMGGIGTGFLLIPVLALCFVGLGPSILTVLQTAWIPIACAASYLFIQLALHGESLYASYVYSVGPWLISLVIVQSLTMHRPNFLHRFAWFTLFVGLGMLPFMALGEVGEYTKVGLEGNVGYSNANTFASWFGFCVLYLIIKGYVETRPAYRLAAWLMAGSLFYIVTLTVSRGALLALGVSLLVSSRRLLKKVGILPVFLLAGLVVGLIGLGIFDQAIRAYTFRGVEETGRLRVWPLLIEKFLNSPGLGVGASQAGAVLSTGSYVTPHNGFLLIAVASGALPLILFCAYVFRSGMAALRANLAQQQDAIFHLPLFVYTLVVICLGNTDFMIPWAIVSLAVPVAARVNQMHRDNTEYPHTRTGR